MTSSQKKAPDAKQFGDSREEGKDRPLARGTIMNQFTHTLNDGIEQYAFPSALNTKQLHFVDRVDGGPWELSIVNTKESLSIDEARTLVAEAEALIDFMAKLNGTELHRNTEPGQPAFEEAI